MSAAVPYLLQGKNIILVIDGKSFVVSKDTHIAYTKIVDALKNKDWDSLRDLVDPRRAIVSYSGGNITIDGNTLKWKGNVFHNALSSRLIEMFHQGLPIEPMVKFMENLMANPSRNSIDQLYKFLERNQLPITEDGHFLAFKKVKAKTYMDIHSGTIRNAVGDVVAMERNQVDDNPNNTCSSGLHFCSQSYLTHFGSSYDPVMIVKINPADVVSIPTDYDGAKGRCCKYVVVAEVNGDPVAAFSSVVSGDYNESTETPESEKVDITFDTADLVPDAAWPFPTGSAPKSPAVVSTLAGKYTLTRLNGTVEYTNLTLNEARDRVAKNLAQKKAKLLIVDSQGKQYN